ncbi:hypothetical protein [uncultured Gammaproteobacteria bacterium]|nr:hypothetical protein [uncultured Gammaproteobacteria bacterium]
MNMAIIGTGPRGISIIEKIHRNIPNKNFIKKLQCTTIYLFDKDELGCGRIWKTTQSECLLMNTISSHVTIYSNKQKNNYYAPSLKEWISGAKNPDIKKYKGIDFVPRRIYGLYLKSSFERMIKKISEYTQVIKRETQVVDINQYGKEQYSLTTASGEKLTDINHIVLALGHSKNINIKRTFNKGLKYIAGDSCADMPLQNISSNNNIFIQGMGLSFYDILSTLTEGRGGLFYSVNNQLVYHPSGNEPSIIAGSRSGIPLLSRGKNQKNANYNVEGIFFNIFNINNRKTIKNTDKLNFKKDIYPLIVKEIQFIYYKHYIYKMFNHEIYDLFKKDFSSINPFYPIPEDIERKYKLKKFKDIDLYSIYRPFIKSNLQSHNEFMRNLLEIIRLDIHNSEEGNIDNPWKASFDIMRDCRDTLRYIIENNYIKDYSFILDFKHTFESVLSFLTAGPPAVRLKQVLALIESKVLTIIAPDYCITQLNKKYYIYSKYHRRDKYLINVFIDGILPNPSLKNRDDLLLKNLHIKGIITEYSRLYKFGIQGGVNVNSALQIINSAGNINKNIFCIGIPTENPNWFTQVGSSTPNKNTYFNQEANKIISTIFSHYG